MTTTQHHPSTHEADHQAMTALPGGTFWMGSNEHYPEEAPARQVHVDGFAIDQNPVTNRAFARFVEATGHVTLSETAPSAAGYPEADPDMLKPGSSLFIRPQRPVPTNNPLLW